MTAVAIPERDPGPSQQKTKGRQWKADHHPTERQDEYHPHHHQKAAGDDGRRPRRQAACSVKRGSGHARPHPLDLFLLRFINHIRILSAAE
jgi:hypothetical protein